MFRSHPASRPTRLVHLQNTTDDASVIPHGLHVPSLSVASQGDCHAHPQRRSRLSASRRSPFPLISWSRSLAERIPERLKAGNDRGGGAVNCAFGRQPGGRAAVFNLGFPTSPRGGARATLHHRYRAVIVHHHITGTNTEERHGKHSCNNGCVTAWSILAIVSQGYTRNNETQR